MVRIENEGDFVRKIFIGLAVHLIVFGGGGLVAWGEMRKQTAQLEELYEQVSQQVIANRELIYARTDARFTRTHWEVEERKIDARFERLTNDITARMTSIDGKLDSIIARMLDKRE